MSLHTELSNLNLEQLRERATKDAGEVRLTKMEKASSGGDEADLRSALTELVVQCMPSFKYRATAVLIRGGPISLVEASLDAAH